MFSLLNLLFAWSLLLLISSAVPSLPSALHQRAVSSLSTPLPPSQDPFYTAPPAYELAAPGTILRIRTAPGNLTSVVANSSSAYNILYRTTDSRYKPSWAVTTLFLPLSASNTTNGALNGTGSGNALLSYQFPYDSPDLDASPSYALYTNPYIELELALGRGWSVSVPDYEGPLAAFGAGVQSGHATLDSVRAVLSSGIGLTPSTRYAMWGYSGGSIASEWAAELQVQYAPELFFSGAALGGLVTNGSTAFDLVNGHLYAGLIPLGTLGFTSQFPESYNFLVSKLKSTGQYNRTAFLSARNMTAPEALAAFAFQDIYSYFVDGRADLHMPPIQKIINSDGVMGYHGVPQIPLYVYKAIGDEVTPIEETDALVDKYCTVGANIFYQRNTVGGHAAEQTNGLAGALEWLSGVLDGTYSSSPLSQGCTIQDVTVNVTSSPL